MGVTLTSPYPMGWPAAKGSKGVVKLRQAFAQNPPVGWGQGEDIGWSEPGNIDLSSRQPVWNQDGTYSTVRSIGFNEDGQEILIPTVINGQVVSDDEAINYYRQTGQHLGKFSSQRAADAYGQLLHEQESRRVGQGQGEEDFGQYAGVEPAPPPARPLPVGWQQQLMQRNPMQDVGRGLGWLSQQVDKPRNVALGLIPSPADFGETPEQVRQAYMANNPPEMLAQNPLPTNEAMAANWQREGTLGSRMAAGANPLQAAMERGQQRTAEQPAAAVISEGLNPINYPLPIAKGAEAVGRVAQKAGEAVAEPTSALGMVARGPMAFAMGAAGGGRPSRAKLSDVQRQAFEAEAKMRGYADEQLKGLRDAFASGEINRENAAKWLGALRDQPVTTVEEGATKASLAVQTGDWETAKQALMQGADAVEAQRQKMLEGMSQLGGRPPKPPRKPPTAQPTAPGPLPPSDAAVVDALPNLPSDQQESVVRILGNTLRRGPANTKAMIAGMSGVQKASHTVGAISGGLYGWNQDSTDDFHTKMWKAALGAEFGARMAHVGFGGAPRDVPNRAMAEFTRQLLTPKTLVAAKMTTDVAGIIAAPMIRGLVATAQRSRSPQQLLGAATGAAAGYFPSDDTKGPGGMDPTMWRIVRAALGGAMGVGATHPEAAWTYAGYHAGIGRGLVAWAKAYGPEANLMHVGSGEARRVIEEASPGQWTTSIMARTIGGFTDFIQEMQKAGVAGGNAPALAVKRAELTKSLSERDSIAKLRSTLETLNDAQADQKAVADALTVKEHIQSYRPEVWTKIESGLWAEPDVAAVAHEIHVNEEVNAWSSTHLPSMEDVAKEWTLTSDPRKGGLVGKASFTLMDMLANIKVPLGKMELPLGRMIAPFTTVVSNAADQFINFVPLVGEFNQALNGYQAGGPAVRLAKQAMGAAVFAAGYSLVGNGATDGGPTNKNEFFKWLDAGNMPFAVHLPWGWTPQKDLPVEIQPLFKAMGALNGWQRDGMKDKDKGAMAQWAVKELFSALGDAMPIQNVISLLAAVVAGGSTWQREAGFMMSGLAGSTLGTAAEASQTTTKDTSGDVLDPLRARIPGMGKELPDKLNRMAQPVPNPQQGWHALLGNFAGKEPPSDKKLEPFLDPKVGSMLNVANEKTFHTGASALPMERDLQRAVFQGTIRLLQERAGILDSKEYKGMSDADKHKTQLALENKAHDDAFFTIVKGDVRDKYLASLVSDPAKQSRFKFEELAHQRQQAWEKAKYADMNGKPVGTPAEWAKNSATLQKYRDNKAIKSTQWPQAVKDLETKRKYGVAGALASMRGSPDLTEFARHEWYKGISDEGWKKLQSGELALYGRPGARSLDDQVKLELDRRWFNALPANDKRKKAMTAQMAAVERASHVAQIEHDHPTPKGLAEQAQAA